jgi:tetratricopeptide (TPR) repeat protein
MPNETFICRGRKRRAEEMMKGLKGIFGRVIGPSCSNDANLNDHQSWYNKGISFMTQCSYEDAISCFGRAAQLDPMDVNAWNNKGICLLSLSRFNEAMECIEKTIEIDPHHAFYWYNKGICQDRLGHLDEAIQSFNKAVELHPKYAEAWFNKAVAEESIGDKKAAIDTWRKYLSVAANDKKQKDWMARAIERLAELERSN